MAYDPAALPVDSIFLAGMPSPGIAKIVGAASRRKADIRGAYGVTSTVAVWLEIAEFKVEISLYTAAHWEACDAAIPLDERQAFAGEWAAAFERARCGGEVTIVRLPLFGCGCSERGSA